MSADRCSVPSVSFFRRCCPSAELSLVCRPSEILKESFRTACEFYDADRVGFLEVDPDSKVWWPFDWLSVKSNDMTKSYLNEFEPLSVLPRWVAAMELNQAIALQDREKIKNEYPEEYALYERVKLYSVLAVPVKPRPCGFL